MKMGTQPNSKAPYIITEKAFWKCPTSVLTGMTFFTVGVFFGALLVAVAI